MKMLIDSDWVDASDGKVREVHNPGSGEKIDTAPEASLDDVAHAVQAAQKGRIAMRQLPAVERAQILFAIAQALEAQKPQLAELLAQENGKPITQIREELNAAIRIFQGFAEEAKRIFGKVVPMDAIPGQKQDLALTIRQPLGVVAAIVPFNYPVELYAHKAGAALAAGNAVITKPPEECPLTLLKIAQLMENAGLPRAAHQVITGAGETVGAALVKAAGVQMVTFTGSVNTGIQISRLAAETLKKVHLELGGNDAVIVCDDADLERAAEAVVLGRLARGNGQICCAVKRVFVDQKVVDRFSDLLIAKTKSLKVGDQMQEDTDVGPLITEEAAKRVEKLVDMAVASGAKIGVGGKRDRAFMQPTVLLDVPLNSDVFRQETFGPVVPVVPFDTIESAIRMTNDSPYGLQAAVFTKDISRAFDIAHRLEVGGVIVNWSSAVRMETLPFGGVKFSGHGRESIYDTILEMTEQKVIYISEALTSYWKDDPLT